MKLYLIYQVEAASDGGNGSTVGAPQHPPRDNLAKEALFVSRAANSTQYIAWF